MTKKTTAQTALILAYQAALRPALPCVYGPVEFREFRDQLIQIDAFLNEGGIESAFIPAAATEHATGLGWCQREGGRAVHPHQCVGAAVQSRTLCHGFEF